MPSVAESMTAVRGAMTGPFLHFRGQDKTRWNVHAGLVVKSGAAVPKAYLEGVQIPHKVIRTFEGHQVVSYDLSSNQTKSGREVSYSIGTTARSQTKFSFYVPGQNENARAIAYSCNGYQTEADRAWGGGIEQMWEQIMAREVSERHALLVGGGDQLYADGTVSNQTQAHIFGKEVHGVFALPSLAKWVPLVKQDRKSALSHEFTAQMRKEVEEFYFNHYIRQFREKGFAKALATIPSLMTPDDHDLFDGCGSYANDLMSCPVISEVKKIALEWCKTFQYLTNDELAETDANMFKAEGTDGLHALRVLDDAKTAVLTVDTRSDRTLEQIVPEKAWDRIFDELDELPESVTQLSVVLACPIAWPFLGAAQGFHEFLTRANQTVQSLFGKVSALSGLFGFELTDDLRDGWDASQHQKEQAYVFSRFAEWAEKRGCRVWYIGGDVHRAGDAIVYPKGHKHNQDKLYSTTRCVTTSPVGNVPSPNVLGTLLELEGKSATPIGDTGLVFKMKKIESADVEGYETLKKVERLLGNRNYFTFQRTPEGDVEGALVVEPRPDGADKGKPLAAYRITIAHPPTREEHLAALADVQQKAQKSALQSIWDRVTGAVGSLWS